MPWYTICTERFSADFGVEEWFGLNVFLRDGDAVYRTYFLQHGPMVQKVGSVWTMFSLTPYGGQGEDERSDGEAFHKLSLLTRDRCKRRSARTLADP